MECNAHVVDRNVEKGTVDVEGEKDSMQTWMIDCESQKNVDPVIIIMHSLLHVD